MACRRSQSANARDLRGVEVHLPVSVIVPTHNPHAGRLGRTLVSLRAQSLPPERWETVLVDNASVSPVNFAGDGPANLRVVREPILGLTAARRRGLWESAGEFVVMVDDDNVLAPDYLERALAHFAANPRIGALGGRSLPEFEAEPPAWVREFDDLLACRDLGITPCISVPDSREYPAFAPIGAGMALRRAALRSWLDDTSAANLPDRRGAALTSSGDNDIIFTVLRSGWQVAYFPDLTLTHLIPANRLQPDYLARLNRGIQQSWQQVLRRHGASPWPVIAPWTVPLRQAKAWFACRAWSSPAARIRWQGACGHFEGRVITRCHTT